MDEDSELLRRYVEDRSDEAFTMLVQRHLPLVHSAALRQVAGDIHCACDVAQTVFTILARKAATVQRHPVLTGWLYTTTHHTAAKALRSDQRRRLREQEASMMHEDTKDSTEAVEWEKVRPVIDSAMFELQECDRVAVLLRFFENRPFAEIGIRLGLNENSARMRVERALDALRGALTKYGITSTSVALGMALANQAVYAAPVALTSSVATGALSATASTSAILFMSTTATKVAVTVLIAGAVAGLILQHQTTNKLRAEIGSLQSEAQLAARLQLENANEIKSLQNAQAESARLQAKVSDLSVQLSHPEKATPPRTMSNAATIPANQGRSTPAAALYTAIWAMNKGDSAALAQAIRIGSTARAQLQEAFDYLPEASRTQFGTPDNLLASLMIGNSKQISAINVLGIDEENADSVTVRASIQDSAGNVGETAFPLNRTADGWQWALPAGMVKGFLSSIGANQSPARSPNN
jgi:RNA polymerase sigma factor (sigma-70 family)